MTLLESRVNQIYRIRSVGEGPLRRRLLDMGFTKGAEVFVSHKAPFGGTFLVGVRGFTVALREDAAGLIELEKTTGAVSDGI